MTPSNTSETTPKTFVVGQTYTTGEARDYVWHFRVVSRTAKFITVVDVSHGTAGEEKRIGVRKGYNGYEVALPLGRYSMAPTISADAALPFLADDEVDPGNRTPDPTRWSAETGVPADEMTEAEAAQVLADVWETRRIVAEAGKARPVLAEVVELRPGLAAEVAAEEAARQANRSEVERLAELVAAGQS